MSGWLAQPSRASALACGIGSALLWVLAACSPLDPLQRGTIIVEPGGGGPGGAGGGNGAGGHDGGTGADTLVVEVRVVDPADLSSSEPAVGAVIAFDPPVGARVEQSVDDTGRVVFDGVDWAADGSGALTAHLQGAPLASILGLTAETVPALAALADDEVLTLRLVPPAEPLVLIGGVATNMADPSHRTVVSTTSRCVAYSSDGPGWSLPVEAGQPLQIVMAESHTPEFPTVSWRGYEENWVKWAQLAHAPISAATAGVELDLAQGALAPTTTSGSFAIPDHGITSFFETASGRAMVSAIDSHQTTLLGYASWLDVAADESSFDYQVVHVEPTSVSRPVTIYWARQDEQRSSLRVLGYPQGGARLDVLPEPVRFAETPLVLPFGEPIEWQMNEVDAADPTLLVQATIRNGFSNEVVWTVTMPPGAPHMDLPTPPSTADPSEVLGVGTLDAIVGHCEPWPHTGGPDGWCRRDSVSTPATLEQ